jgi:UDP-3-O-[3-hydroxymyristoyl] N-acetylglucosamine deacetylase
MRQGVLISTTEHVLAALYSCNVDNVFVDLDALEVPILDGSSQPFVAMLQKAGIRKLRRKRRYLQVLRPLEFADGDRSIGVYPADEFRVRCLVDYSHPAVGRQEVEILVDRNTFSHVLAPARTFGFVKDFDGLRANGLIRGGSLDNAIVLNEDSVMNGPLRFEDEFGRHKALDLIGDLALIGLPLLGRVEAHKAGHALHTQLVTRLLADPSLWTITAAEPASAVQRPQTDSAGSFSAAEARAAG